MSKKHYMILAVVMHAGVIGFAFQLSRTASLQSSFQPCAMQAEFMVQREEGEPHLNDQAGLSELPNPVQTRLSDVENPTEILMEPRKTKSEPQPVFPDKPAPEGSLPQPRRDKAPPLIATLPRPSSNPLESAEQPVANDEADLTVARTFFDGVPSADTPPRLLNRNWPNLLQEGFEGEVLIVVVVAPEGHVISVKILKGTGNVNWDEKLKNLFQYSAYTPGYTSGKPVLCSHQFRITFRRG